MAEFTEDQFDEYWGATEILRIRQNPLFTFGDTKLPYVFVADDRDSENRTWVRRGILTFYKPSFIMPGRSGPELDEGFENTLPREVYSICRYMKVPYSRLRNMPASERSLEYGCFPEVSANLAAEMKTNGNIETGLIMGLSPGEEVSLVRYSFELFKASGSANVSELFEHIRMQSKNKPIGLNVTVTEEDMRRLFG